MAKVVVLGDAEVGKTSMVNRFVDRTFNASYFATVGVDYVSRTCVRAAQLAFVSAWVHDRRI